MQKTAWIKWVHEDEMPDMPNDVFSRAYHVSAVVDGVRMYPFANLGDKWLLLIDMSHQGTIEGYRCSDPMDV